MVAKVIHNVAGKYRLLIYAL